MAKFEELDAVGRQVWKQLENASPRMQADVASRFVTKPDQKVLRGRTGPASTRTGRRSAR